jgi:hypothetical protein
MANPQHPISQQAARAKTHTDARTDSMWWYFSAGGVPIAVPSATTSTGGNDGSSRSS